MIRSFKYPLYPNKAQEAAFEGILSKCCDLYNAALEERKSMYRLLGKSPSFFSQCKSLTEIRSEDKAYAKISTTILRSPLRRLQRAFEAFFRRIKSGETPGYPRFRSKRRYDSFSLLVKPSIEGDRVLIPNLGWIRFKPTRALLGLPKDATIRRTAAGKWEVVIQCDLGTAPSKTEIKTVVGIDMGLITLATLSDGSKILNHRWGKRSQELLADRQRKLALKGKGSNSRKKAKVLVAKAHEHVRNQRLDACRKAAKQIISKYDLICVEDLDIRGMIEKDQENNTHLTKSTYDAAWNTLFGCIANKAEEAGKTIIRVDPRETSKECSGCGIAVTKTLRDRDHICPRCGLVMDRDLNASLNIKARAACARWRAVMKQPESVASDFRGKAIDHHDFDLMSKMAEEKVFEPSASERQEQRLQSLIDKGLVERDFPIFDYSPDEKLDAHHWTYRLSEEGIKVRDSHECRFSGPPRV